MESNKKELLVVIHPIKWLVIIGKLIETLKKHQIVHYTLACDFTALKATSSRFSLFAY